MKKYITHLIEHKIGLDHPGIFSHREFISEDRDYSQRPFTIGIGGPVGSGKTALIRQLCIQLREKYSLGVITNDIFTKEDAEFLTNNKALPSNRIAGVETGGCPHAAIREDVSANLRALEQMYEEHKDIELFIVESGGDNLAAHFSRELADYTIYVIDVSGGDKIPRKGGPGITQSDLLIINKIDLAKLIGADLDVMKNDTLKMRGNGPFVFAKVTDNQGMDAIIAHILSAYQKKKD